MLDFSGLPLFSLREREGRGSRCTFATRDRESLEAVSAAMGGIAAGRRAGGLLNGIRHGAARTLGCATCFHSRPRSVDSAATAPVSCKSNLAFFGRATSCQTPLLLNLNPLLAKHAHVIPKAAPFRQSLLKLRAFSGQPPSIATAVSLERQLGTDHCLVRMLVLLIPSHGPVL